MKRFQITRESIVARPIKFSSLYTALMQSEGGDAFPELKKAKKRADKTLSKVRCCFDPANISPILSRF